MNISCSNPYCVYWHKHFCILTSISISISGICDNCIYAEAEESYLKSKRLDYLISHGEDEALDLKNISSDFFDEE